MHTLIHLPRKEVFCPARLVKTRKGQVCSMELTSGSLVQFCLFAFDAGEGVSEETYGDAVFYYVLDGGMSVCLGGCAQDEVPAGNFFWIEPDAAHGLTGTAPYKLFQIMIQSGKERKTMNPFIKHLEHAKSLPLKEQIAYETNQVASMTLASQEEIGLTLFAFDAGTKIGPHGAPGDAMAMILEGEAEIMIGNEPHTVCGGECIVMPANVQHIVKAVTPFKMLLIVVKPGK